MKYGTFKLGCSLIGSEGIKQTGMLYADVCKWLTENKHKLFGYYFQQGNHFWEGNKKWDATS